MPNSIINQHQTSIFVHPKRLTFIPFESNPNHHSSIILSHNDGTKIINYNCLKANNPMGNICVKSTEYDPVI